MARKNDKAAKPGYRMSIGGLALAAGAALFGWWAASRRRDATAPGNAEHPAPDLALDRPHPGPDHRAPDAFRPDPTAPVPPSERDGLRPATGPAPSLVEDRGSMRSQTGPGGGRSGLP